MADVIEHEWHPGPLERAAMAHEETILEEAARITAGDRQAAYGHPHDDYTRTAALVSAYLGVPVTAAQAAMIVLLVKVSREAHRPGRDNLVDIAGYARVIEKINARDGLEGYVDG